MSRLRRRLERARLPSISQYKPSKSIILFILIALITFLLGGGVYDVMERPLTVLPTPSNPVFYYPGMTDQFLNESLIFMLFLAMGSAGGLVAYRSTRYAYRPRESRLLLMVGIGLLVIAFIGCEVMLNLKGL